MTAGVSAGPLSLSGRLGSGSSRETTFPVYPETMEEAIATALQEGWHLTMRRQWTVRIERGWQAMCIYQVQGGTQVRPSMGTRMTNLLLIGVIVVVGLFGLAML